jgi:hypothetical protein
VPASASSALLCLSEMNFRSTFTSFAENAKGVGFKESHNQAALSDDDGGVRAIQWSGMCSNMPSTFLGHSESLRFGFKDCSSSAGTGTKATSYS